MTVVPRETTTAADGEDLGLRGHYSGFVSRFVGYVVDLGVSTGIFLLALAAASFAASLVTGHAIDWTKGDAGVGIGLLAWQFVYYAYSWAAAGKTFGMALLGVRVVRRDGADLDATHAIIRTLAFPLSFLLCGLGFVGILVGRERRALHDVIADTAVVYTWDARAQRLHFLARHTAQDDTAPRDTAPPDTAPRVPAQPDRRAGETAAEPLDGVTIPAQAPAEVAAAVAQANADVPVPPQGSDHAAVGGNADKPARIPAEVPVPAEAGADVSVWTEATADATVPAQPDPPERDAAPPGR
jgi:uncharacterized RDD family membrane protein YckC